MNSNINKTYHLFGHSAGGQFVHRMVICKPESSIDVAISANAGWYTLPDKERDYPYGVAGAPYTDSNLKKAFLKNLIIFLGTDDTDISRGGFRTRKEAMLQGGNRLERGQYFCKTSKSIAEQAGAVYNWQIVYADGIGHSYRKMAKAALKLIRNQKAGS